MGVTYFTVPAEEVPIPLAGVLRYMGVPSRAADRTSVELAQRSIGELSPAYRACFDVLSVRVEADGVDFGLFLPPAGRWQKTCPLRSGNYICGDHRT